MAVWLFAPLPAVLVIATLFQRRELWVGSFLLLAIATWLWGGLFLPRPNTALAGSPVLTVMSYNPLGTFTDTGPVLDVLRAENADVVLFQELNVQLAAALRDQLADAYPYQVLEPIPDDGIAGMGAISKYPMRPTGERLPLRWIGVPQLLTLEWNGRGLSLVNYHTFPTQVLPPGILTYLFRVREMQAQALVDYAQRARQQGPVIAAGDTNVTDLSEAYRIITRGRLQDAWRQSGQGFGHTWGGSAILAHPDAVPAPGRWLQWVARIDYIFYSDDLASVEARVARFDGGSDHRAVVARLVPLGW